MQRKLILLIDPEPSVRAVLRICLVHLGGWEVKAMALPSQAIPVVGQLNPDAIFLDAPALQDQGKSIIAALQSSAQTQIPIVLITGQANWFSQKQLQDMGAVGAISKPFNPLHLPGQLRDILDWTIDALG